MAGMIPLKSHVPANAPTNNNINNAPVTDLTLLEMFLSISLYDTL